MSEPRSPSPPEETVDKEGYEVGEMSLSLQVKLLRAIECSCLALWD
jgi:hypothetical protein